LLRGAMLAGGGALAYQAGTGEILGELRRRREQDIVRLVDAWLHPRDLVAAGLASHAPGGE
jgi:hypothetical protein